MLKYHGISAAGVLLLCVLAVSLLSSTSLPGGFLGGAHATEVFAEEHHHHDHDHDHDHDQDHHDHEEHGHHEHDHEEHAEHEHDHEHVEHAHDHEHTEHAHQHEHVEHAHEHEEHDHHDHAHEEHAHEGHKHEGHDHKGHGHEGHAHNHEEHNHHHGGHGKPHDHHHGHGHGKIKPNDHHHGHGHGKVQAVDNTEVWKQAVGGTLFVTAGGNAAIVIFLRRDISPNQLRVMVSFAVGGLLGDVFLHLLPHAMEADDSHSHDHHDHHDHSEHAHDHSHSTKVGLALLAGILSFFMVEKALRAAGGGGGHGHSHAPKQQEVSAEEEEEEEEEEEDEQPSRTTGPKSSGLRHRGKGKKDNGTASDDDANNGKDKKKNNKEGSGSWLRDIQPGAILNMTADTVHNFTDGMAIAAACQVSPAVGRTMIIAVLFHEIPHEVGDFAVLVSQGFSRSMAFKAQFVSALGALLGCVFGCAVSSQQPAAILAFTAGGFIYISLVNIVPDLLENEDSSLKQTAMEVLAICTGIFMMVLIAVYEPHV